MIEILPNWHPVFVHFTIALLSMAVVFHLLKAILPTKNEYQVALSILAKSNLLIGTGFAIMTAIAGWFAYNSVAHDTPSHLAMTEHRNWALLTLGIFIVLALWSLLQKHKMTLIFIPALLIAGGLLATTGWLGGEAVYRYGLGVKSMPNSSGEGHAHQHGGGEGHAHQHEEGENDAHQHQEGEEHGEKTANQAMLDKHNESSSTTEHNKEEHKRDKSHNETPHKH